MKQITVPIPLEQVKAVHRICLEFNSILSITDREKFDGLMNLLEPLSERLANVAFDEWDSLIDEAEKNGGAE